jgi:hypothetical protein
MTDTLRIGPIDYKIVEVQNLHSSDGKRLFGEINYANCVLNLNVTLLGDDKARRLITMWHEVIHAIVEQAGSRLNEDKTNMLAHGIVSVLLNNPSMRGGHD